MTTQRIALILGTASNTTLTPWPTLIPLTVTSPGFSGLPLSVFNTKLKTLLTNKNKAQARALSDAENEPYPKDHVILKPNNVRPEQYEDKTWKKEIRHWYTETQIPAQTPGGFPFSLTADTHTPSPYKQAEYYWF